jgi:hypothetical protein
MVKTVARAQDMMDAATAHADGGDPPNDFAGTEDDVIGELAATYEHVYVAIADRPAKATLATHREATTFATRRAGDLIKDVSTATHDSVKVAVANTIESGGTVRDLKNTLRSDPAFGDARAAMIAQTETMNANGSATLGAYKANGTETKSWLAGGESECDLCSGNADEGDIPVDDDFSSGDDSPTAHPGCACTLMPGTVGEEN